MEKKSEKRPLSVPVLCCLRLLSHGDYDAADLQGKTKRSEYLTFFVLSPF